MTALRLLIVVLLLGAGFGKPTAAHETRPVFLSLRETQTGIYDVTWKRPVFGQHPVRVEPRFEAGCRRQAGGAAQRSEDSVTERFVLRCDAGLAGSRITLVGLSGLMIDGLIRIELDSGQTATAVVRPQDPVWRAPRSTGGLEVFGQYVRLGVEHILSGFDHLLFVLGLVLLVRDARRLLWAATAFTLAHSLTLSAAALGLVQIPPPPIEALIALSIVFVALEIVRSRQSPAATGINRPAVLAFGFGLLHGLGFAGALARIGLPRHEIPMALFSFNVGVEIGQILFIGVLFGLAFMVRRLGFRRQDWALTAGTYLVGSLGMFWTIQRMSAF